MVEVVDEEVGIFEVAEKGEIGSESAEQKPAMT